MSLIRIIVIGLIIYLVIQIFKRWSANKAAIQKKSKPEYLEQNMVSCEICQLHVPQDEALEQSGKYYCSQKHLDQSSDQ